MKIKKLLIDIFSNNYNISLRIIDWFVTNYCKKKYMLGNK